LRTLRRDDAAYRTHERVQYADGKGCATGERLSHVELSVWVIFVILVKELDIGVVT